MGSPSQRCKKQDCLLQRKIQLKRKCPVVPDEKESKAKKPKIVTLSKSDTEAIMREDEERREERKRQKFARKVYEEEKVTKKSRRWPVKSKPVKKMM